MIQGRAPKFSTLFFRGRPPRPRNPLGRKASGLLACGILPDPSPVIAYLFTTFPKSTETFLQREIVAMQAHGITPRLYSLWGGGGTFRGLPVTRFPKWKLLTLVWMIPYESWRRPDVLKQVLRGVATRRPPSWLNFWENMLGAGFACLYAGHFRRDPPTLVHAAWGGAPATAAWMLWRFDGHRYTAAAHAYDIYEHGGDWWLREKLEPAAFVHTSTEMGRRALVDRGVPAERIHCIRRGLDRLPPLKRLRPAREPLRLLAVARLVEKKGLRHQLRIHAALRAAGIAFEARIVGEGPLRAELERLAGQLGIAASVTFVGPLPNHEVWNQLAWADVLLHTGIVAPSGDRDGLPNVIPEAMCVGTLVVTSPAAATTEAVTDGVTGLVAPVETPAAWVDALCSLATDDARAERLRQAARRWVEENFNAHDNAGRLLALFRATAGRGAQEKKAAVATTPATLSP
jgi:glycosyltransferase involved in cell wall biosynthesis